MRIWSSIIAYQDAPCVRGALEALRTFCADADKMPILVVDGRYRSFPAMTTSGDSEDGMRAVTEEFGGLYLPGWGPEGWPAQYVKRTAQFCGAVEGDWVLCVDSDEKIRGSFDALTEWTRSGGYDHGRILVLGEDGYGAARFAAHRFFRVTRGFHLFSSHFAHWRGGRDLCSRKDTSRNVPQEAAYLYHDVDKRDKERLIHKQAYYGVAHQDEWRRVHLDPLVLD